MKLINCDIEELYVGTVFRFKGGYPFTEEYVDFMICDYPNCGENHSPFALYCVSGYCSGHLEYVFPLEAQSENFRSISKLWIIENWNNKIYGECDVKEVEIVDRIN